MYDAEREAEIDTLARTLWGEAHGDGEAGMVAIAAIVVNRVRISTALDGRHWWGATIESVCRSRAQFSCWNPGNPDRAQLLALDDRDTQFRLARAIAERAVDGLLHDPTYGATSYKLVGQPWPPSWGRPRLPLATIGHHEFYNFLED